MTLFAPNDEAMKDKNLTQDDLLYHAVEGLIKFSDITHEFVENSVAGSRIRFNSYDDDKVSFNILSFTEKINGGLGNKYIVILGTNNILKNVSIFLYSYKLSLATNLINYDWKPHNKLTLDKVETDKVDEFIYNLQNWWLWILDCHPKFWTRLKAIIPFLKEKTAQGVLIDSKNVDLAVTNGSIHVLTAVMSPPSSTIYEWIENNSKFTQLKDAIDKAELKEIFNST